MRCVVYLGASLDGFIARADGSVDFLDVVEPEGDLGFADFMAGVDALLMGRNTYDHVVDSGYDWAYGETPVYVWTSRPLDPLVDTVEAVSGEVADVVEELERRGVGTLYVDGGHVVQTFLRSGLADELTITTVPVLIGDGISLYGPLDHDVFLTHVGTTSWPSGFVQSRYRVNRAG